MKTLPIAFGFLLLVSLSVCIGARHSITTWDENTAMLRVTHGWPFTWCMIERTEGKLIAIYWSIVKLGANTVIGVMITVASIIRFRGTLNFCRTCQCSVSDLLAFSAFVSAAIGLYCWNLFYYRTLLMFPREVVIVLAIVLANSLVVAARFVFALVKSRGTYLNKE